MKQPKRWGQKLLSVLLTLMMLLSMLPASVFAADAGTIALLAVNAQGQIIEPGYLSYRSNDTVKDALKASGHTFTGIEDGFITAIDGQEGSYSLHYDGDGYALDQAASEVTALWFTTNTEQAYGPHLLSLVKAMAQFNASTNGVKDYEAAKTAYQAACQSFYDADNAGAQSLAQSLSAAMSKYDKFLAGETVPITVNATMDGAALTPDEMVFTGEFGNVVTVKNTTSAALVPGSYTYVITKDAFHRARGTVEVTEGTTVQAQLPSGRWIGDVTVGIDSSWKEYGEMTRDHVTPEGATYYIPDFASGKLFPCIAPGKDVSVSDTGLWREGTYNLNEKISWESKSSLLPRAYEPNSLEGTTLTCEAHARSVDPSGYAYQSYTLTLVRTPSLRDLTVSGNGDTLAIGYRNTIKDYALTTTAQALEITPTALCEGTTLTVNGHQVTSGQPTTVTLAECTQDAAGVYQIPVVIAAPNGQSTTYTLAVTQKAPAQVRLTHDADVTVTVTTESGTPVTPQSVGQTEDVYQLVPDTKYTYDAVKGTYYHSVSTFTSAANQTVSVAAPRTEDWLTQLSAKLSSTQNAPELDSVPAFSPQKHEYTFLADSNTSQFFLKALTANEKTYETVAHYTCHANSYSPDSVQEKKPGTTSYTNMLNFLAVGGWGNRMRLQVTDTTPGEVTYYQEYFLQVNRSMTLNSLSATDKAGAPLILTQKNAPETTHFDKFALDYTTTMSQRVPEIRLTFRPLSTFKKDDAFTVKAACGAWSQEIQYGPDVSPKEEQTITVPMDPTQPKETVTLTVSHGAEGSVPQTYTIEITKLPPVVTTFTVDPDNAVIFLTDNTNKARILPEQDGTFILSSGISYTYVITKDGFVGQSQSFVAGEATKHQTIKLEKAPDNALPDLTRPGDWHQFRADNNNNGVVDVKTPIKAEDSVLVWANKIGEGYSGGATGCPIIVGGFIYTYAGKSIVKIDKETGELLKSAPMAASSSFAINSPTYANGMIFVGLSNGRVQAFSADSLEPLWLYQDALKGQPNCPITYRDGYIYTGFWNSEKKAANFVCLSVTDEDPDKPDEAKLPTWTHTDKGFYWAGAFAGKGFLLVPTDDGQTGYITGHGDLLSLNPVDGTVIDTLTMPNVGDLRSSICYDELTDAYYFTSKGGDFYQVRVNEDGTFQKDSLRRLHLNNGSDDPSLPPMSTSTPVIYKGRAYVGVSGTAQFGAYSGHNMTVIDLDSFSIAYSIPTQGYPQVSGLLTTAYEDTGYIYVYFMDNYTPGKLRVIRDQAGRTTPDPEYLTQETYQVNGQTRTVDAGYVLFTPSGDQAQYAICSPIVDSDGNIYFKNDSAQMMRLSSTITHLEITQQPDHLTYEVGQTFDGTGLKVTAHYANGLSRDITPFISFTAEPLTANDTEITITYDLNKRLHGDKPHWKLYQDKDGTAGTPYDLPTATVNITVNEQHTWDEGKITKAPTCTEPGEIVYTCVSCGQTKTEVLPVVPHTLTHVPATVPTCTEAGAVEHYHCSVCNKNFADADAATELTDVTIPAAGHTLTHVPATVPSCTEAGTVEHYHCAVCNKNFADADAAAELTDVTIPATGHTLTHVPATVPSCTEAGTVEHYHCSVCNKNFADADAAAELTDVTIPATGHTLTYVAEVPATDKAEGVKAHWVCDVCHKLFADADGLQEVTSADLVIAKLPSPATGDCRHISFFAAAMGSSLVALAAFGVIARRRKHAGK